MQKKNSKENAGKGKSYLLEERPDFQSNRGAAR